MSDKTGDDTVSSSNVAGGGATNPTSQPVHVFPPHRGIPPTTVPPGVLPSFIENRHNSTSSSFGSRPSHHFPTSTYP